MNIPLNVSYIILYWIGIENQAKNKEVSEQADILTSGYNDARTQDLCESWNGRPGLPVPNRSYGLWTPKH